MADQVTEHVWAIIDWWRAANEAPGGCSDREAIDGMREHVIALRDLTDYGTPRLDPDHAPQAPSEWSWSGGHWMRHAPCGRHEKIDDQDRHRCP